MNSLSLIHDSLLEFNWNYASHPKISKVSPFLAQPTPEQCANIELVAEDLRDGLQGAMRYPTVDEMLEYINLLHSFGITRLSLGVFSGTRNKLDYTIKSLLREVYKHYPNIIPIVACPITKQAMDWALTCKKAHPNVQVSFFMGMSGLKCIAEGWTKGYVLNEMEKAFKWAQSNSIRTLGVIENATQANPDFIKDVILTQVKNGATAIIIADTVGIARPVAVARIIQFVKQILKSIDAEYVGIEWHGHRDLGNDMQNTFTAIACGVKSIHTVARGIGERAGNTRLESVVLNLYQIAKESGYAVPWDLSKLLNILQLYDKIADLPPPIHGPLGNHFNYTNVGTHCSAILHLLQKADDAEKNKSKIKALWFRKKAQNIYNAFDMDVLGINSISIGVGPFSGKSSVLLAHKLLTGKKKNLSLIKINKVLTYAKKIRRVMSMDELLRLFRGVKPK